MIYIRAVANQDFTGMTDRALLEQVARDASEVKLGMAALHAELDEFRPLLALFKPGNGASDVQRAGVLRAMRKAARGGG